MIPPRGDAVCTSRRCELRHLAAWAERVITRRQIDVSVDRVGVRHPRLQQFSPCLVAGSHQYPRVGEVEPMAFPPAYEVRTGLYRGMFNPARLITGLEDMANNFGRGYYGCPQNLVDQGMNAVRKEAEQADKLQACLIFHSFGGGTGAGTTCRLVELMDAEFMKIPKIEMAIYPDYHKSCSVVEPYNAVLCSSTLDEVSSFAIMVENDALTKICIESLRMERPSYPNLNRVLSLACSGILAPLCFDGPLTASLPQLQTNLVPYPRLHFLQASLCPMFTHDTTIHEAITIQELTVGAFSSINQMMVGDPKETVMMATALLFRGQIPIQEINSSIDTIKKRGLIGLVDWCPTGFKIGVVPNLPVFIKASGIGKTNRQLTTLYNSTLIVSPLKANLHKFRVLLSKKAFLHWYLQEGMEQGEFQECMEDVKNILQDYLFVESK
ncbi:Tubulin alpha-1C chain [Sparganum proliferum]